VLPLARVLAPLTSYLADTCHHPAIVSALLALKAHFAAEEESSDDPGVNEARGYACEYVAWQFLVNLTDREIIDFLLYELPPIASPSAEGSDTEEQDTTLRNGSSARVSDRTPLLGATRTSSYFGTDTVEASATSIARSDDFAAQYENLTALEVAAVSNSKKFLKQKPVQKIINGLWRVRTSHLILSPFLLTLQGDIVFWESLSLHSVKSPKLYNRKRADPCTLCSPK
jgi:hypothetical protein